MSRELKFRAWDNSRQSIVKWSNQFFSDMSVITSYGSEFPESDDKDMILMQYTGLKDSSDEKVEIYEGDIVRVEAHYQGDKWFESYRMSIEFSDGSFNVCSSEILNFDIKVIGNIHENPELLKDNK